MLPSPLPTVVFQRIDDGAVLFSPATEVYFGLNEVGARVWQLLPPASASLDELCAELGKEYPGVDSAVIRQDVSELLAELVKEGLAAAPGSGSEPDAGNAP